MVKKHQTPENPTLWLEHVATTRSAADIQLLKSTLDLFPATTEAQSHRQLEVADILLSLGLDTETLVAALAFPVVQANQIDLDIVTDFLGEACRKLLQDVLQIQSLEQFRDSLNRPTHQIENLRKMLLAMVTDVRAVFIVLAERLRLLRHAREMTQEERLKLAQETHDVYAPLANRLGIWQLKWEIEDLCLRYLQHESYMKIAKGIAAKRTQRESHVANVKTILQNVLQNGGLAEFEVTGRVKHIYSIYRKMQRKHAGLDEIYDMTALRILVKTVKDCYTALSILQNEWEQIPQEFDDYIAQPKPNGYRSIHTVLIGPENHIIEVQIRTFQMHQESELGVAAHWRYKEGVLQTSSYEAKIALLRQVLEWQQEVSVVDKAASNQSMQDLFLDRIYVFTPTGDIIDLPKTATPLDFAYHIHSEVGHRCRGAKVNGDMVSLTTHLKTGDRIEILTAKLAQPSRDWMNAQYGYLNTARARAKVQHWFRGKDNIHLAAQGRELLEKELKRLGIFTPYDIDVITQKLHYKSSESLLSAVAAGVIKLTQLIHHIAPDLSAPSFPKIEIQAEKPRVLSNVSISGISNLLTHIARCCKPIPGDLVNGYITRARGVSIHRHDCANLAHLIEMDSHRLIAVNWEGQQHGAYSADLCIQSADRPGLLRDITTLLLGEKITLLGLQTQGSSLEKTVDIYLTIGIHDRVQLSQAMNALRHVDSVVSVSRR